MKKPHKIMTVMGVSTLIMVAAAREANAATGTLAGTSITNTATVGYSIGGIAQGTVTSNTASFLVDRKANMTVALVTNTATQTSYTATSQVIAFTVTNTTNGTQDFRLVATDDGIGATTGMSHTATFLATNLHTYVDTQGTGVYNPTLDTTTYVDELAPGASATVFVVADIPATGPASGIGGVYLTAVVAAGGASGSLGADLTASVLDDPTQVDTVFADAAGWGDSARDGKFSADGEYDIYGVSATATKTATLISDPINGNTAPKSIPGAIEEYCIAVKNTGAQSIANVNITDIVPTNTTYLPGSIYTGGTVLAGVCNLDGSAVSDASGFNGTRISTTAATLGAGVTTTTRFRVTLN